MVAPCEGWKKGRILGVVLALLLATWLLLLVTTPAQATTLEKLSVDQLAQRATTIVVAKTTSVRSQAVRRSASGSEAFPVETVAELQVAEVLKGNSSPRQQASTPGGSVGGRSLTIDLMPRFSVGETSLLFLDEQGRVIGGFQGKLDIKDGEVVAFRQPLAAVKGRVQQVLAGSESLPTPHFTFDTDGKRTGFILDKPVYSPTTVAGGAEAAASGALPPYFSDGFENGLSQWVVFGSSEPTGSKATWATTTYRKASGNRSAYCVGSLKAPPGPYPANVDAVMIAGPFDLSATVTAYLDYDIWVDAESSYDGVAFLLSTDGVNFSAYTWSGRDRQFFHVTEFSPLDSRITAITGQSTVWLAVEFYSDATGQYEGCYVDNVRLAADPRESTAVIDSITPASASAGTGSLVTITGTGFGSYSGTGSDDCVNFPWAAGGPMVQAPVVSWSDTSIVAEVPVGMVDGFPHAAASGRVTVSTGPFPGDVSAGCDFVVPFGYEGHRRASSGATYRVNANTMDTSNEEAMVDAAAATWSAASSFSFTDGGASTTSDYLTDGYNDLFWSSSLLPTGVLAATSLVYDSVTGDMVENDVCFNDTYLWGTGSGSSMDVQTVALHELGHWLCLMDQYGAGDSPKVMYGYASQGVQKRALTSGDIAGITWIYGNPSISSLVPSSGPTFGDETVVIRGRGFRGVTGVTFGGVPAASYSVDSSTQITAVSPPNAAGSARIEVMTVDGPTADVPTAYYTYADVLNRYEPDQGTFRVYADYEGGWADISDPSASGGIYSKSTTTNASITIYFKGSALDWIATKDSGTGKADVYMDDVLVETVDLSAPTVIYQACVWSTTLPYGYHKFTIKWNPTNPVGKYITLDRVDILGKQTPERPTIKGMSAYYGPVSGGNRVEIYGSGFAILGDIPAITSVTFGGVRATSFTIRSNTQISAVVPAHASGPVRVQVVGDGGPNVHTTKDDYIFGPPEVPTVTGVNPNTGPAMESSVVTITGTGFYAVTQVYFGSGHYSTNYTVDNPTQITATTPLMSDPGTYAVRVVVAGSWWSPDTAQGDYTFIPPPPPTVTALEPVSGSTAGGTFVTITGTNLLGAYMVNFGGKWATGIDVVDSTTITCTSPAHDPGPVDVTVTTPGGISSAEETGDDFTYVVPITATRYDQTDDHIVKTGVWTDFDNTAAYLGSYGRSSTPYASASVWLTGTKIAWIGMTGSTPGIVDVYLDGDKKTTLDLYSSPAHYQVTLWTSDTLPYGTHHLELVRNSTSLSGEYLVLDAVDIWGEIKAAPPTVTSLSPASGPVDGGTTVTITGTKLTGATQVRFGEALATDVHVVSATQITCTTPAHDSGVVDVTVTTPSGTSPTSGSGNDYTFTTPAPTVTALSPATGLTPGGTSVTITGTYLTGATAVSFGGEPATNVHVDSATQITCTAPAHAPGTVDVTVTTPGGGTSSTAGTGNDYLYVAPVPTISGLAPASGSTSGGANVTITGTGFYGTLAVSFGGVPGRITQVSYTQMTAVTPAHVAGTVEVTITTDGGTTANPGPENDYTFAAPMPSVTGVAPSTGPTLGGTAVTLTGIGFIGATAVTFGGDAATDVTVVSPTRITCTSPAHAEGTVDVRVTTAGGTSSPEDIRDDFTYVLIVDPLRYEQTDPHIVKVGDWSDYTKLGLASADTYGRSLTGGASATIYFEGTQIDFVAMTGSTPGIVDIYLDGDLKDTVDLYSSPAAYNETVWSSGTIDAGSHKLELKRSPASLASEYITLDAVDIVGHITDAPPPPAAITSVTPASGPIAGGTSVTIIGTSLTGATNVTFGGTPATGVSVNPVGTQLTCTAPAHAAGPVNVVVIASAGTATASGAFTYTEPGAGPTRYEQDDEHIMKTGGWSDYDKPGLASADSYGRSATNGASATIYFTGTQIAWVAMTGSTPGKVDIYLDDEFQETIDLYSSPAAYDVTVWTSPLLTEGLHSFKIVNTSTKYVTLDALDIWGTIADPPPGPTRYEQTDSHIVKVGDWSDYAKPGLASGDSYGRSNTPGASATIYFTGTRLDYIAMTGSTPGKVDVYLDDEFKETIDLYSSPAAYNSLVWSTGALTEDSHKVELRRSASSDAGEYLTLDGIDIWGTIDSGP